jgi:hypothetical protein
VGLKKSIHTNLIVVHSTDLVTNKADRAGWVLAERKHSSVYIASYTQVEMQLYLNEKSCGLRYISVILEVYPDLEL